MASNSERNYLDPTLYDAAERGDMDLLEEILGARQPQQDETAIHVEGEARPSRQHSRSPANRLLGVTHGGNTALHIAARFGHLPVARRICEEDVSLLMKVNAKLWTPLHFAAGNGRQEMVADFIQLASVASNIDLGEMLTKKTTHGETALYLAVLFKQPDVVQKFLHADVNQYAVYVSQLVSIPNKENISPLYLAILRGFFDIASSLMNSIREHADVSRSGAYAGPDGQTALHAAAQVYSQGLVDEILEWKPELAKSTDISGSTPLHYAAASGNLEAVSTILQKADITCAYIPDLSGLYPVHLAVKMGYVSIVAMLFDLCRDMNELLDKNGRNYVHLAVEFKREDIVSWICSKPERARVINVRDNNGDTAMHLAVKAGNINIFARLLGTEMAHLGMMNKDGLTPYDLAISMQTVGFSHSQNPDKMMVKALFEIRHCLGTNRRDQFQSEQMLRYDQKKEKMVENYESMAKSMAIGSVLIASAALTAAFSVCAAYKADILAGHNFPGLNIAFMSFILMVAYAFVCSITATCIIMEAAMTFLDPEYRKKCILMSVNLIEMATRGFVASFSIGVYVVLIPVSKWLACVVCVTGAALPVLIQPYLCPNILLIGALIRYLEWRGFFLGCLREFWENILFGSSVLIVLVGSTIASVFQPFQAYPAIPTIFVLAIPTVIILRRGVNENRLPIYPTRIVFDKTGMGKDFFSLAYWVWVWVRIFFR